MTEIITIKRKITTMLQFTLAVVFNKSMNVSSKWKLLFRRKNINRYRAIPLLYGGIDDPLNFELYNEMLYDCSSI